MIIDTTLDKLISKAIREKNLEREKGHKSSGKLSASTLGWPLQWQILKSLGVQSGEIDDYTLRKFERGRDVEDWALKYLPCTDKQKLVEYRGAIGYADAICKDMPFEIKSVANAKYKRILKMGADRGHVLQAGFYGAGLGSDKFAVCYIASDDYRIHTLIYDTYKYVGEIDEIIEDYNVQKAKGTIPVFEAKEVWQKNKKYNRYPGWSDLTEEQIKTKWEGTNGLQACI